MRRLTPLSARAARLLVAGLIVALFATTGGCVGRASSGAAEWDSALSDAGFAPGGVAARESSATPAGLRVPDLRVPAGDSAAIRTAFDAGRAMQDVRALAAIGVRRAGSAEEARAAEYIEGRLRGLGYEPRTLTFTLPDGRTSRSVVAMAEGRSDRTLILGAHIDSKAPSPGANDNASGVAVLLEVARHLAEERSDVTVELDFFGAEEVSDDDPDHHHAGSRDRAARFSAAERARLAGMLSVDMVGHGRAAHVRTMGRGPRTLADAVIAEGRRRGLTVTYLRDPGPTGWSDHEAFEQLGLPSAWFEWRPDPVYHTERDTAAHLSTSVLRRSGELVLGLARGLDADEAAELRR